MKKVIAIIAIILIAVFANYITAPANVTYVGEAYAAEGFVAKRTIVEVDGRLTISTCTREQIESLKAYAKADCISPEYVGSADVLVKSAVDGYKTRVRAAMDKSIQMYSVEVVDGWITE
ncbi:hypothetical protein Dxin01_00197 [Deinococcus xinjiangensis]|uniref:Uncharacterized protein n=1 Tax=Deinococcus xinjiangensis TaxID=457454 RepID=A0ABP9V5E5_9DEIO